jgi:hypothetical protein
MAMAFLLNLELSIDYQCPILDKLGDLSQGELIITVIASDIIVGIVGAIGIIFGFGILKMQKGAWMANVIYNIIFTLLSVDAFAENCSTPRFISRYSERDPAYSLVYATTCVHLRQAQIPQR